MNARENIGSLEPDGLVYDCMHPLDTKCVTVAGGQGLLRRGSVLAVPDCDGNAVLWDGDSSGHADSVLCDDTDTGGDTDAAVRALAYRSGHFSRHALSIGAIAAADGSGLTQAAEKQLREGGIFLSNTMR